MCGETTQIIKLVYTSTEREYFLKLLQKVLNPEQKPCRFPVHLSSKHGETPFVLVNPLACAGHDGLKAHLQVTAQSDKVKKEKLHSLKGRLKTYLSVCVSS